MRMMILILGLALLSGAAQAKDHDYQIGTVTAATLDNGTWRDTTACFGDNPLTLSCEGGIYENTTTTLTLTLADGAKFTMEHIGFGHDVLGHVKDGVLTVKYREGKEIEIGGNYHLAYILMDNGKESKYKLSKVRDRAAKIQPGLAQ